jgi:tRNA threonylcarbamoyl adenosine modification protein YjeE
MEEFITDDFSKTENLGLLTARKVLDEPICEKAIVFVLEGELGAGKTTFLQGFAKGLGIRLKIQSPSFVIMNHFKLKNNKFKDYYHFDCYRLKSEEDVVIFDLEKLFNNPKNIICFEWGSNIKKILPKGKKEIDFKVLKDNKRKIIIK